MQTHAVTNYTRSPETKRPRFYRPTENGAEKEKKIEMQQKKSLIQNRISLKKKVGVSERTNAD